MTDPLNDLRRYARDLERQVPPERAHNRVTMVLAETHRTRRPRRTVIAIATAGVMALSNVALATVADPAVPGDVLYPVDRAYERAAAVVGLGGSNAPERIDEATVMLERGEAAVALSLVQEALAEIAETEDVDHARQILADLVEKSQVFNDSAFADQMSALLGVVAATAEGDVDGEAVAEAARALRQAATSDVAENTEAGDHATSGEAEGASDHRPGEFGVDPPDGSTP